MRSHNLKPLTNVNNHDPSPDTLPVISLLRKKVTICQALKHHSKSNKWPLHIKPPPTLPNNPRENKDN